MSSIENFHLYLSHGMNTEIHQDTFFGFVIGSLRYNHCANDLSWSHVGNDVALKTLLNENVIQSASWFILRKLAPFCII